MSLLLLWDSRRRDKGTGRSQAGREKTLEQQKSTLPEQWQINVEFKDNKTTFIKDRLYHNVDWSIKTELSGSTAEKSNIYINAKRLINGKSSGNKPGQRKHL